MSDIVLDAILSDLEGAFDNAATTLEVDFESNDEEITALRSALDGLTLQLIDLNAWLVDRKVLPQEWLDSGGFVPVDWRR